MSPASLMGQGLRKQFSPSSDSRTSTAPGSRWAKRPGRSREKPIRERARGSGSSIWAHSLREPEAIQLWLLR
jgi:hypothetical protein